VVAAVGQIPTDFQRVQNIPDASAKLIAPYQFNASPLVRQTPTGERQLGQLIIYADKSVAIRRVKYSFFVILINSLVKTAGLWLIFYLVISKGLSRHLSHLTEVVSKFEFAADSQEIMTLDYPHQDELGRLLGSMQKMQWRLYSAHHELAQVNVRLEEIVTERTLYLSEALQFNETILLSSPLSMGVYTATGACMMVNAAYARLMGVTRDTLLAQNFNDMPCWQQSGLLGDCETALHLQNPVNRELKMRTSSGIDVWVESRVLPIHLKGQDHLLVQLIDLTERKRAEEEWRHYATHDVLTRLPNRRLLLDRLKQAVTSSHRYHQYGAILFLDLNKFKYLNDTHGHEAGDLLLIEVARRLKQATREVDTVARLGGDEFVVVLETLGTDAGQATHFAGLLANKLRQLLSEEYVLGDIRHQGSASIGITLFGGDCHDPDQLLKDADAAMYEAKRGIGR